MGFFQILLDAFLPHHCAHCRAVGTPLCLACQASMQFETITAPSDRGYPYTCTARLKDNLVLRSAIHAMKYSGVRSLAPLLATRMRDALVGHDILLGSPILVPVPMWPARQHARGYNQAQELAHHLGLLCALEVRNDILIKTRDTGSQVSSSGRQERIAHMASTFAMHDTLPHQPIVIVDDVITTGATVTACHQALLGAGAREVRVLGLAHG